MQCLKCGKTIDEGAVFCGTCLKDMANYPVKPGTAIQILARPAVPERKAQKKREDPREVILQQRKLLRGLLGWIALLTLVILLLTGILIYIIRAFF